MGRKIKPVGRITGPKMRPYALAVGEVALAWNDLHEWLALLFWHTLAGDHTHQAVALWNTQKFDRPKREMLLAASKSLTEEKEKRFPKLAAEIEWIAKMANLLEDARNDAIHSPLLYFPVPQPGGGIGYSDTVRAFSASNNPRARNLQTKQDLLAEFRWCRDTAIALTDHCYAVEECLAEAAQKDNPLLPWPDRPTLPNRGQKKRPRGRSRQRSPK